MYLFVVVFFLATLHSSSLFQGQTNRFRRSPATYIFVLDTSLPRNYRSFALLSIVSLTFCVLFSVCDTILFEAANRVRSVVL